MRNPRLLGAEIPFINARSLGVLNDMFFRLPFPDGPRMEKVHAKAMVTPDVLNFLNEMQSDFDNVQAMSDLKTGWDNYLRTEIKVSDDRETGPTPANPAKYSMSARRARNSTPTESE
jgi:hypothetical protein